MKELTWNCLWLRRIFFAWSECATEFVSWFFFFFFFACMIIEILCCTWRFPHILFFPRSTCDEKKVHNLTTVIWDFPDAKILSFLMVNPPPSPHLYGFRLLPLTGRDMFLGSCDDLGFIDEDPGALLWQIYISIFWWRSGAILIVLPPPPHLIRADNAGVIVNPKGEMKGQLGSKTLNPPPPNPKSFFIFSLIRPVRRWLTRALRWLAPRICHHGAHWEGVRRPLAQDRQRRQRHRLMRSRHPLPCCASFFLFLSESRVSFGTEDIENGRFPPSSPSPSSLSL